MAERTECSDREPHAVPDVSAIIISPAPPSEAERGVLAWVSCTLAGRCRIDGLAIRRTLQGELRVTFPARRDRGGRRHAYVWPIDRDDRASIEHEILHAWFQSGSEARA